MKLHLDEGDGNRIRAHAPGRVVVNDRTYTRSLIVMPDRIIVDWPPRCFEELQAEHLEFVAAQGPEIVLLGTGARLRFPEPCLAALLAGRGVGFEVMDTAAACRTYNILMADGRRVAAAILFERTPPLAAQKSESSE